VVGAGRLEWNSRQRWPRFAGTHWLLISANRSAANAYPSLEGGPHVLPAYPRSFAEPHWNNCSASGVECRLPQWSARLKRSDLHRRNANERRTSFCGLPEMAASSLGKKLGVPVDRAGRVWSSLTSVFPAIPEVFVIGDLASLKDKTGKVASGVAPVAILEGRYVAKLIRRETTPSLNRKSANSAPRKAFHYFDKGSLATIGRAAAVAQFGKIHISGYVAWLAWLFVHILSNCFQNRVLVLTQWAWSYFTYERGAGSLPRHESSRWVVLSSVMMG